MKKRFLVYIIIVLVINITVIGQTNPEQWFGSQYEDAIKQCEDNKTLIASTLSNCCLPVDMAISIAFPEMLRYSLWQNIIETKALEILYVTKGETVADFSIGWLQMKPSFAEQVEDKIAQSPDLYKKYKSLLMDSQQGIVQKRELRVERLKEFSWQLLYLSAFVDLNCSILKKRYNIPDDKLIAYLSAIYNHGMDKDIDRIEESLNDKTFPYGYGHNNPFAYGYVVKYFYVNNATMLFYNI
jgi:hypothetical protein